MCDGVSLTLVLDRNGRRIQVQDVRNNLGPIRGAAWLLNQLVEVGGDLGDTFVHHASCDECGAWFQGGTGDDTLHLGGMYATQEDLRHDLGREWWEEISRDGEWILTCPKCQVRIRAQAPQ